jgi:SAM-dependent methyltransferase
MAVRSIWYNEALVRLAEAYLRRFHDWNTARLWSRPPLPGWFDHRADVHRWSRSRDPGFAERGTYAREVMKPGARVLDCCCGDGFYSYHFFSGTAGRIDAVDADPKGIAGARRRHALSTIQYHVLDVAREPLPNPSYDVVVWDTAMQYFSLEDIHAVCRKIAGALGPQGLLVGMVPLVPEVRKDLGEKHHFRDADAVRALLEEHFPDVALLERPSPPQVYFRCGAAGAPLGGFQRRGVPRE